MEGNGQIHDTHTQTHTHTQSHTYTEMHLAAQLIRSNNLDVRCEEEEGEVLIVPKFMDKV